MSSRPNDGGPHRRNRCACPRMLLRRRFGSLNTGWDGGRVFRPNQTFGLQEDEERFTLEFFEALSLLLFLTDFSFAFVGEAFICLSNSDSA